MNVKKRLLPADNPKRVGRMIPKYITIHETSLGLDVQPADKNYERYRNMLLDNSSNVGGYHFLVEANVGTSPSVYQFLETNVSAYHTGNSVGNADSIGIERLVNSDTDMEKAVDIQAQLTATLMYIFEIPLENVVPHKYWSGKECPARLLAGLYGGWAGFIKKVECHFDKENWIDGVL